MRYERAILRKSLGSVVRCVASERVLWNGDCPRNLFSVSRPLCTTDPLIFASFALQLLKDYEFLRNDLEDWTKQLFAVEKRFLARLKDRDAAIVYSLEALLETTQEKVRLTLSLFYLPRPGFAFDRLLKPSIIWKLHKTD